MITATCIEARIHPNADKLTVYRFKAGTDEYQIVANQTNRYRIRDQVKLVLPGETFEGIEIVAREVRGVASAGMAVGLADENPA